MINSPLTSNDPAAMFQRAAEVFGLLSTTTRLRIVACLCEREMSVSELVDRLAIPQPTMSQQLSLLHRAGLISRRRDGTNMFYRTAGAAAAFLCSAVRSLTG